MKEIAKTLVMMLAAVCLASCNDDDNSINAGGGDGSDLTDDTSTGVTTTSAPDFNSFSIEQSTEATGETVAEPTSRSQSVTITFSKDGTATSSDGTLATVSGQSVTASTADVNYILTGSTAEGSSASFTYKGSGDCTITLSGVDINTTAKAIGATKGGNIELVVEGKNSITTTAKKTIEVGDDTENEDGTLATYQKLDIYGSGSLSVESDAKGAISSTDAMTINPGVVLNVTVGSDATGKKGIKSDTSIDFKGGRTTVANNAAAEWDETDGDYSAATCVKAPTINVSGGTVQCKATGNGGKGLRADNTMTVTDGTVEVITTGSNLVRYNNADKVVSMSQLDSYSNYEDANPKGIHVGDKDAGTGNLTVSGGKVKVKVANSEGIESKMYVNISGGTVEAYAGDDAINAGISSENNRGNAYAGKGQVNISGGTVYAYSTDNDAIDANGTISISGGVVVASGNTAPECGIDCDQSTFAITGGYVIGMGGDTSKPTESSCTQSSLITSASVSEGDILTLQIGGSTVMKTEMPRTYSSATFLISTPEMKKGTAYAIYRGSSSVTSGTLSSSSYVNGSSSGMGGGGFPGGGGIPGGGR
ncbi:MAG: carbohydrate-binding domain-containing protein [Prevotella sp.]|nr:carbohydrate-binding domain-containing protein [Prevotella sp.]MBQ9237370.1 carbohydrate-binding domain-containing protein [Prevotella sp.]